MLRSGDSAHPEERVAAGRARKRRNLAPALLLALLTGGIFFGASTIPNQGGRLASLLAGGQPLPDGTVVKLEKVTFGRTHRLGPPPGRLPWLPGWLTGNVTDAPPIEVGSSRNAMMLWITQRHPAMPRRTRALEWWTDYRLVDSHGCRFDSYSRELRVQGKLSSHSSSISRGDRFTPPSPVDPTAFAVGVMELESFPRREPTMKLQLIGAGWDPAAEFSVDNPAAGSHPEWTPLPLPQTQADGDLAVRLTNVRGILDQWESNGAKIRQQRVQPRFQMQQGGKRTDDWEARDVRLSDATGNEVYSSDCRLCLREKAWKLRARLWRKAKARFSEEETWVVEDVPVQNPGKFRALSGSSVVNGIKLELLAIAGRGSFTYENGVPKTGSLLPDGESHSGTMSTGGSTSTGASGRHTKSDVRAGLPHVGVRVGDLGEEHRLSLLAIDDQGREIESGISSSMDQERYLGLDLPKDARTLTLRLMVHRCRTVEYLIRPPAFTPPGR